MKGTRTSINSEVARIINQRRDLIASAWVENQFAPSLFQRFPNEYAASTPRDRVVRSFIYPLLNLLAEYSRTGNDLYRELYLSERRRFAPHRDGGATLRDFFSAVLPTDEAAITRHANGSADGIRTWLADLHAPLTSEPKGGRFCLLTVGDCLLSEIQSFLLPLCLDARLDLDLRYFYFSATIGADIEQDGILEALKSNPVDAIALSYLSYSGLPAYRRLLSEPKSAGVSEIAAIVEGISSFMRSHMSQIRAHTDAPILLHNVSGLPLGRFRGRIPFVDPHGSVIKDRLRMMNTHISRLADEIPNCILIDEVSVAAHHGLRSSHQSVLAGRQWKGAEFHFAQFGRHLAAPYFEILQDLMRLKKTKLLLVDFDNTLWNGVMADGPVSHFRDRQQLLKRLQEEGILLAAISKNDERNIRWDEMLLKPEDFVSLKLNWNPKYTSISEVAQELNLGEDSFLLIDDNPVERELVKKELPKVVSMDSNDEKTWVALERLLRMPNTRRTEEARSRTELYRQQSARSSAIVQDGADVEKLMRGLELRAKIGKARAEDMDRLTELVQRTNQFNTTTIRYTRGEMESLAASREHSVLVGELADKFGNLGIVCVAILSRNAHTTTIENFVMSCRAMGFGMEFLMLAKAIEGADENTRIVGRFIPSGRNSPSANFYNSSGFVEEEPGVWVANRSNRVTAPEWINCQSR